MVEEAALLAGVLDAASVVDVVSRRTELEV